MSENNIEVTAALLTDNALKGDLTRLFNPVVVRLKIL